jgi:hypothetical protein
MNKRKWTDQETEDYVEDKLDAIEEILRVAVDEISDRADFKAASDFIWAVGVFVTEYAQERDKDLLPQSTHP